MRTDVKVAVISAFTIVLCVIIYFVSRGGSHPATAKTAVTPDLTPASAASSDSLLPSKPVTSAMPGSTVGGGLISVPGGGTSATTPPTPPTTPSSLATAGPSNTSSTPALGATSLTSTTPTTPGMSPSASSSTPTTPSSLSTPSTPILSTTPLISGTPAAGPTMELAPLPGTSSTSGLTGTSSAATTYKIQKGDMLGPIAKKFGVTVTALQAANPGIDSSRLKIDTIIKIPAATAVASNKPATATPGAATAQTTAAAGKPAAGTAAATTIKPGTTYKVKKGDTLSTIAKAAYGTKGSWKKLYQANQKALTDPDVVPVGTQIVIP